MKKKQNRGRFFEGFKCILRIFKRKPEFVFLGENFQEKAIYLSNHVGSSGPLTYELYFPLEMSLWGTYEMNDTTKNRYKYLSRIYFHNKKHLPLWLSKIVAVIATPFMGCFYKGIRLISTYPDGRMVITIKKTIAKFKETNEAIIIFPEDSSKGYYDILKAFHPGFYALADRLYSKENIDVPIYLMYIQRLNKRIIVDKPIMFSKIKELNLDMKTVANLYLQRANKLALFTDEDIKIEKQKEHFLLDEKDI